MMRSGPTRRHPWPEAVGISMSLEQIAFPNRSPRIPWVALSALLLVVSTSLALTNDASAQEPLGSDSTQSASSSLSNGGSAATALTPGSDSAGDRGAPTSLSSLSASGSSLSADQIIQILEDD